MGVVYRAEDVLLRRTVALKFLPVTLALDERARVRLLEEARTASKLDHPNVCTVYEVGQTADGRTFIAMPCYEGTTLRDLIEEGPLSVDDAADYARQILAGLEAAHAVGVVHRDIKPENVFVTRQGTAKILDFGLAVLSEGETAADVTAGTAAYMSPEQARGSAVDAATDIWSFGVVFYEMLTGERPFSGEYDRAVLYNVMYAEPDETAAVPSEALMTIVRRCLAKDPAERFESASDAAEAVQAAMAERTRQTRFRRGAAIAAVFVMLLLAVGLSPIGRPAVQQVQAMIGLASDDAAIRHVAVLPLSSYGGDAERDAFAEGLFEVLAGDLSTLGSGDGTIWVVPSVDVRELGVRTVDLARDELGAQLVVTGSAHWSASKVRLTINLIETATRRQVDSEIVEGSVDEAGLLTRRVASAAARMIGIGPSAGGLGTSDPFADGATGRGDGIFTVAPPGGTVAPGAAEFYVTARGYLQRFDRVEDLDAAIDLLQRAVREDETFARAHAALAEAYMRKFDATGDDQFVAPAAAYADTALTLADDVADVRIAVGIVQRGVGSYEAAARNLSAAVKMDPLNALAHREIGRTYERLAAVNEGGSYYPRAEAHLRQAVLLRPAYWAGYHYLGVYYFRRGRLEDAVAQFEEVTKLAPRNPRAYTYMGTAYQLLGRIEEAREAFSMAVELGPDVYTYYNLATVYFFEHRFSRAAELYRLAVEENDTQYWLWAGLGEALYWSSAPRADAVTAFERAIELTEDALAVDPRDYLARAYLASMNAYVGKVDRAETVIAGVLAAHPDDGEVLARAAEVYALAGRRDRAARYVEEALEHGFNGYYVEWSPLLRPLLTEEGVSTPG